MLVLSHNFLPPPFPNLMICKLGYTASMKRTSPKWLQAEDFLVCNLTGSRTHFEKSETIHPFSKSNQGKSNFKELWLGRMDAKKYTFYDGTVINTKRKQIRTKRERKNKKKQQTGLISHFK